MIIPELLARIYTDDIYLINEQENKEIPASTPAEISDAPIQSKAKDAAKKEVKPFEHLVLSDIEPNPGQKELLEKILQAVGLNISKIKIIVGVEYPENIVAKNLISFNVASAEVTAAEKYKVMETASGKILLADSLAVLDTDVSRKKALWQALQKMYAK